MERLSGATPDLLGFLAPLAVFLVHCCFGGVCCVVTAPGGRELWPLVRGCCGKMRSRNAGGSVCVSGLISCLRVACGCTMRTSIMASSDEDLTLMGDLLEDARLEFLMLPFGTSIEDVNAVFWEFVTLGRRELPSDVLVCVRVRGRYRRAVRLQRWVQRQLLVLRESTVARCVLVVIGHAEI